eukprot:CAMPEP_0203879394 /NCGR_PEP_ID=MMETSP0359-20131031/23879_1 /ASSEMBLY_ACC=CAM_ASM_000338 /TAXON_ID=268821 /ORGANISM="Scrippsiella Hangoei, Strain SHTV-5" /LENGTH=752 /DNA_ID=CAMNT_0050798817 /DNA_START=78 /DNA_END=2336 /DNA_ORIENTATION=-
MAEKFVGIDLSVCNTVVSCSSKDEPSAVVVAVNDVSNRSTPAAVGFDGKMRLVGESAETRISQLPKQVVNALPAILGSTEAARANYARFGCLWNFTEEGRIGPMSFGVRDDLTLHPSSVLAPLLQTLVSYAAGDAVMGLKPGDEGSVQNFELAISTPDGCSDAELSALRGAIDILGWKPEMTHVLPYSAALATGYAARFGQKLGADEEKRVVVFVDIGYSQTSISVAKFMPPAADAETKELAVDASSCSDETLGTHAFCASLLQHVNKQIEGKGQEVVKLASKRGARLLTALQKSVKELSMLKDTTLGLECFFSDEGDLKVELNRGQFEEVIKPNMDALVALVQRALTEAGVTAEEVHSVELVGGGMRIPRVQTLLSEIFPSPKEEGDEEAAADSTGKAVSKRLRFSLDGASAVASGAAHYAAGRRGLKAKWDLSAQTSALGDDKALAECRELEAWMAQVNSEEQMRLAKGNELESYIFQVRNMLSGPDRALLKPETTEPLVEEASRWFEDAHYDQTTTLQVYEERLAGLRSALEEHGAAYYEKKTKEHDDKEKMLDAAAAAERQRRQDAGMDVDKDDRKMAKSERMKMATKNKEEGNSVFKAGNLEDAAARYQRALQHINKFYMLDLSPDEKAEADAVTLSIQLNLANVFLKIAATVEKDQGKEKAEEVYKKVKFATEEALKIDADNVKAKFRKASAMEKLGDLDGAVKEVKSALKADPENADLVKLKEKFDKLQAAQNAKAKKIYGKMFG